ncbi:hypothetical protein MNBD_ALPHA12-1903 [hydrothermal vent metagenome]|uniref:O-antigen ligase-related domain-containing protein n=1 Tax=hydrothermal vent metagenome TaxID=652676 RepID=A0A3B0U7W0_9ZZZZ
MPAAKTSLLSFERQFLWMALALSAVAPAVLGSITPFLLLLISIVYFVLAAFRARRPVFHADMISWTFFAVIALQLILAALSARQIGDVAFGLNLLPLLLYPFSVPIISRARIKNPLVLFAFVALLGAAFAFFVAFVAVFLFGFDRGSFAHVNPNDLSGLALLFGFLALAGIVGLTSRWRFVFFLGPVFALLTILLTGSRGALLAYLAMAVVATWFMLPARRRLGVAIATIGVLGVGVFLLADIFQIERVVSIFRIASAIAGGQPVLDEASSQRLIMYAAGWRAFLQSPFYGHGWANIMNAVSPFIPLDVANRKDIVGLPQLHNDVINFAVTGGVLGIASYFALLVAPLAGVRKLAADRFSKPRNLAVALLITCYGVRGLSDLMLGFEYGTSFFAMTLALIIGLLGTGNERGEDESLKPASGLEAT